MGIIEIDTSAKIITISSNIIGYGNAADYTICKHISEEIETMWNEPNAVVELYNNLFQVRFKIQTQFNSLMHPNSIIQNENPRNNYIRIEQYCNMNISFMDAIGSNSGYFLLANLYKGSTSAAHEYGHSLGLPHPLNLNILGAGRPSIMYPRGSIVDAEFQNDVLAQPGGPGGTLNPQSRKVMQENIDQLQLPQKINNNVFVLGRLTNKYHEAHQKIA